MARFTVVLSTAVLVVLAGIELVASGCGNNSPRPLQSVSVNPATADARTFPNGQVQFTAAGIYSAPPSPSPITQPGCHCQIPVLLRLMRTGWHNATQAHREQLP